MTNLSGTTAHTRNSFEAQRPCTITGHNACRLAEDEVGGDVGLMHSTVDASGIEVIYGQYPAGDPRNDDTDITAVGISLPQFNDCDYTVNEAKHLHAALGQVLASQGQPISVWTAPAWMDGEPTFDRGCVYAERAVTVEGVTVTMTETDHIEFDTATSTYTVTRQPASVAIPGEFDDQHLTIGEARTMINYPAKGPGVHSVTALARALTEVIATYDGAAR